MHRAIEPKFQRTVSRWLYLTTAACLVAPFSIPLIGKEASPLILALPMAVCVAFWAALIIQSWPWRPSGLDQHSVYVKEKYPAIWRKLHPIDDFTPSRFAHYRFARGHYDDGNDAHLNSIKSGLMRLHRLMLWPFLLVPATWVIWCLIYFYWYPVHWVRVAG